MKEESSIIKPSRRDFLKTSGKLAAASAFAGMAVPFVHGAESNTINIALIGCGGRGSGAAANALSVKNGPTKLIAMADVFDHRLKGSYNGLKGNRRIAHLVDVPEERKFLGFDAYKKAMDCLRPGDVAIFTTPLAFRWVHFTYAISKGINVFMEKPLTSDGPTSRKMIKLAEEATAKNLKVGVGLMSRHSHALQQLHKRIEDGEIGDITLMRGYRMSGPIGFFASPPKPDNISDLMYQVQRFHSFIWAGGGCFSDFLIHHIDHLCWMKNAWPVKAQALGGRHYKQGPEGVTYVDQNFDSYAVEYIFEDGARFLMDGRCITGAMPLYNSYIHGTKGSAIASKNGDCGLPSATFSVQKPERSKMLWQSDIPPEFQDPYQNEWNVLIDSIRNDTPHNEVKRGVEASVTTSMGRKAAHTGQEVTFDEMLNDDVTLAPDADKFTYDSPAPVMPDKDGRYPVPMPGLVTKTEYPI